MKLFLHEFFFWIYLVIVLSVISLYLFENKCFCCLELNLLALGGSAARFFNVFSSIDMIVSIFFNFLFFFSFIFFTEDLFFIKRALLLFSLLYAVFLH